MRIDLENFFIYFDEKNPNHIRAAKLLEAALESKAPELLDDNHEWIKTHRTPFIPPRPQTQEIRITARFSDFPWFPQTDNFAQPSRTCNSSACAMALEFFKPGTLKGARGDDDYLRKVFAVGDTTDHNVQTKVLNSYGIDSTFSYKMTFADLDAQLRSGRPVVIGILHRGPLSNPTGGHMVTVIGKTPNGDYVCNDPYGSMNNGYSGPVEQGRGVVYKAQELARRWCPAGNDGWGRIFATEPPRRLSENIALLNEKK